MVEQVWKKEVGSLEFKDALVIGEREENGGTMLQSWYEKKNRVAEQRNKLGRQILGYWNFEVRAVSYNGISKSSFSSWPASSLLQFTRYFWKCDTTRVQKPNSNKLKVATFCGLFSSDTRETPLVRVSHVRMCDFFYVLVMAGTVFYFLFF